MLLLHGWPYDIHSFDEVVPVLAAAGFRVVVPFLRGYGTTVFRSADAVRNGQQAALAVDAIALMDALGIADAVVGGFDWGARTAAILAALWPERCRGLVSVSGYLIGSQQANRDPLPPAAELAWWYQYYFATDRGRSGYDRYRREFARLIWQTASPNWSFDDATFERSAASFDNPDHVDIVIHNYRWRLGLAPGEPEYDDLERRLAAHPSSPSRRSHSRATRTERRIRGRAPTATASPDRMSIASSPAGSATTSPRRRHGSSRRQCSTSRACDDPLDRASAWRGLGRVAR